MATRSQQVVRQRARTRRGRFALGGLYSVARGRGATYPWVGRVTRPGGCVTRLCGAIVEGLRRRIGAAAVSKGHREAFFAPHGVASVGDRVAAVFRAVDLFSLFGLELIPALRVCACSFHGPSIGKRNGTMGTNGKSKTVYFHLWNEEERLWKSGSVRCRGA